MTEPIFVKITPVPHYFVNNSFDEFDEQPTNDLFPDTMSQTDGQTDVRSSLLLQKERATTDDALQSSHRMMFGDKEY